MKSILALSLVLFSFSLFAGGTFSAFSRPPKLDGIYARKFEDNTDYCQFVSHEEDRPAGFRKSRLTVHNKPERLGFFWATDYTYGEKKCSYQGEVTYIDGHRFYLDAANNLVEKYWDAFNRASAFLPFGTYEVKHLYERVTDKDELLHVQELLLKAERIWLGERKAAAETKRREQQKAAAEQAQQEDKRRQKEEELEQLRAELEELRKA